VGVLLGDALTARAEEKIMKIVDVAQSRPSASRVQVWGAIAASLVLVALAGCGSSGGSGPASQGTVSLEGRVVPGPGLAAARAITRADQTVVGITVTAEQNGTTVDTTTTDAEGAFALTVAPGRVTLRFTAQGLDVSVDMTVPEGSTVTVTITLTSTSAEVDEGVVTKSRLSCDHGSLGVDVGDATSLVVDGHGGACILATGNCALAIRARDVTLTGCDGCIDARGTSDVSVAASGGELVCESSGDGVSATGNARVSLGSAGRLSIESGSGAGIAAGGNSTVEIASATRCEVSGADGAISEQGSAQVSTDGCASLDASP
jgi:hypothetical protein